MTAFDLATLTLAVVTLAIFFSVIVVLAVQLGRARKDADDARQILYLAGYTL